MQIANNRRSQGGFTVVELIVTLFVVAEILVASLILFDLHNELARVQNNVADMQQSLRGAQREMVSTVRMAGRGGLPTQLGAGPAAGVPISQTGLAVSVINNAGSNVRAVAADATTKVLPGTDILRIRGIFETPIYQLSSTALGAEATLTLLPDPENPATATSGSLVINNPSPTGVPQDLEFLSPQGVNPNPNLGRGLLLVSPLDDTIYAVVAITAIAENRVAGLLTSVTVTFSTSGHARSSDYRSLFSAAGNLPDNLRTVAFAGLLEDHIYYVREARAIPGDATSDLTPKLSRAEMFPGSNVALSTDLGRIEVADNVMDLQVALGYNSAQAGYFTPAQSDALVITETANGQSDDWLYNTSADNHSASPWVSPWTVANPLPDLQYVRLTTLVRTDRRDFQYVAPPIQRIEDRNYGETADPATEANRLDRMFRRRLLQTVVDMRNL
ncbi:MAG: hypothetical protein AAF604_03795 [Acidobacteriota bacterium]